MCKLAYVSKIDKLSLKQKENLLKIVQDEVTKTERSGYGLAAKNLDGSIDMFRTLDVKQYPFRPEDAPDFCEPKSIGEVNLDALTEVIFHGRTSTNSVSIPNTHPFYIGDTILCHNGVMQYKGEKYDKQTDNDTEDLTYHFDKYGLDHIDKALTGYAAFIAFKNNKTYIVRDSIAPLYYSYIRQLDCHIFATKEATVNRIKQLLGAKKAKTFFVKDNISICIENNKIISNEKWTGLPDSYYAREKSSLSLGHDISDEKKSGISTPTIFSNDNYLSSQYGYGSDDNYDEDLKRFFDEDSLCLEEEAGNISIELDGQKITASRYLKLDPYFQGQCVVKNIKLGAS